MGKVYDALRRAEQQRTQSAAEQPVQAAPLEWAPASPPVARPRPPFWKRWFSRGATRQRSADVAGDLNKRRVALLEPDSFVAEQFRSLRARIEAAERERPVRTLAFTSALAGEGKTTAAINLALVSSMNVDCRVLLVDCDLRSPKVHRALGLRPAFGLAEVLAGEARLDEAVVKVDGTTLEVLPVRREPSNPSELLASGAMHDLLAQLAERYDRVVLDTPPTLSLPDAKTMSEHCDGFVLVVRAGSTRQDEVEAALEILDRRRLLGLVLNGAEVAARRYRYPS